MEREGFSWEMRLQFIFWYLGIVVVLIEVAVAGVVE